MPQKLTVTFLLSSLIFFVTASSSGIFSLISLIIADFSMLLFVCFGIVSIFCRINKKISPYFVFAVTDCLMGIAAFLLLKCELFPFMIFAVPSAVVALIVDLVLWNKDNKSPKISDLYKRTRYPLFRLMMK